MIRYHRVKVSTLPTAHQRCSINLVVGAADSAPMLVRRLPWRQRGSSLAGLARRWNGTAAPNKRQEYSSPLTGRYTSKEMAYNWSEEKKFVTFRKLWVALAQAQHELGLEQVKASHVEELRRFVHLINYEVAEAKEKEIRHDVMSHIHAYGVQCPGAAGIIHLGATSCYVGDNTDLILMRDGLDLIQAQLLRVIIALRESR